MPQKTDFNPNPVAVFLHNLHILETTQGTMEVSDTEVREAIEHSIKRFIIDNEEYRDRDYSMYTNMGNNAVNKVMREFILEAKAQTHLLTKEKKKAWLVLHTDPNDYFDPDYFI